MEADDSGVVLEVLLNDEAGGGGALSLSGFVPGSASIGDVNNGLLGNDGDNGTAYLMYSAQTTQSRFADVVGGQADHLIVVKHNGTDWLFNDYVTGQGDTWSSFTPVSSDVLLAEVTMQSGDDAVASLEGQSFVVEGIEAGYASGDLTFIANQWQDVYNRDEYDVTGTTFTRNIRTAHGRVVDNGDGTLTYTPDTGYTGSDGFRYTASDGQAYGVSASDLEAHYALSEGSGATSTDGSGNGLTLTLDGAGWTAGRVGALGYSGGGGALALDGVDDFASATGLASTSQMTLSAWIRPTDRIGEQTIVGQSGSFAFKLSGGQLRFTTPGVADHTVGSGVADVVAGEWQHVAVSFDAGQTGGANFYLNGELVAMLDASTMATNSNDLWVGKNQWGQFFGGSIDDVRIDSRVLSADEVAILAEVSVASVSLSVNADVDIESARDTLLAGVTSLADPTQPGHMVVYGPTAFSVSNYAGADLSDPMIAAATWGAGRVVALPDHQWLEMGALGGDASTAAFYGNGIEWLADSASLGVKVVTYNHSANAGWLTAQGYTNVVNATSATLAAELADADVLVAGWLGANPPAVDLDTIRGFVVNQGGGLFIAEYAVGYDWWWGQATEEIPGNRLLREAGIGFVKAYPHGGGAQAINRATGQVTAGDMLALLNDSSGATQVQKDQAASIFAALNGLLAEDDVLQSQLDAAFWARIETINPTPGTPVSDSFEQTLLQREMDLLGDLPPEEVTAHRTAEDVYGTIPSNTPRLTNEPLKVDADATGLIATGLYAAPSELITVTLPTALVGQGYTLRINNHVDSIAGHSSYARVPYNVSRSFAIDRTTVQIANAFGGHIYLDMGGQAGGTSSGLGNQSITIDGAIAAPMFVLGSTTDTQWINTIRDNPAPYAEFVSQHLAFSVPSDWIRTLDNPTALMQYWDDVVSLMDYVAGTEALRTGPERINLDVVISSGLLHAGYPIQGPTSYGSSIIDLATLTTQGDWGWFHELGHEIQRQTAVGWGYDNPWTFGGDVEVTVNLFANAALERLAPGTGTAGWGYSAHPDAVMAAAIATINDTNASHFDQKDPYPFYFQLADGFGWDLYRTVLSGYVDDAQNNPTNLPQDNQQEKDQWLTRWSQATGYNLVEYMVNQWGLEVSQSAIDAVNAMSLPSWLPVVPGETTLRVAQAGYLVLDPAVTAQALDGPATLTALATTSAHGATVLPNDDGTFTYLPAPGFTGTDLIEATYQRAAGGTFTTTLVIDVFQLDTQPDKSQWELIALDSQEIGLENGAGINAFDGDPGTIWHTHYSSGSVPHPHTLALDLGAVYALDGFTYLPRQDGANGRIADYTFETSTDGVNWTTAATGTFANTDAPQEVAFASTTAQYVRLTAQSEVNANAWTSVADLWLSGVFVADAPAVPEHTSHWAFDEGTGTTAADSEINNATGTITSAQWVAGVHNHALAFNGQDSVVHLGTDAALEGTTDFTIAAWINTTDTNGGTLIQQRDNGTPGYQGQYRLRVDVEGRLNFLIYNDSQYQFNFTTTQAVNDGRWHHVVVQRDNLEGRIYIDGVLTATAYSTEIKALSPAIGVAIGSDIRDNNDFFKGIIDDVRLENRTLDAAEIAALYDAAPNLAPAALADYAVTAVEAAATINVLDNDFDHNADDTLSITGFTQGAHGTVIDNGDGTLTYTPDTGFGSSHAQLDTFTYTVSDGNGGATTATVLVSVGTPQTPNDFTATGGTLQSSATGNYQYELDLDFINAPASIEQVIIDWGNGRISHGTTAASWGPDLTVTGTNLWTATQHVYDEDQVQLIQTFAVDTNGNVYQAGVTLDSTQVPVFDLFAHVYSSTSARLSWGEQMVGESGFQVSVSTDGGDNYTVLGTTAPDATAYLAQGLPAGAAVMFQVEALAGPGGGGLFSTAADQTPEPVQLDAVMPGADGRWYLVNIPVSAWIEKAPTTGYTHVGSNIIQAQQIVTDWLDAETLQLGWEVVWATSAKDAILEAIDENSTFVTVRNEVGMTHTFDNIRSNGAFQVGTVADLTEEFGGAGFNLEMVPDDQYVITLEDSFKWQDVDEDFDDWYWEVDVHALDFFLTVEDPRDVNGARGVSVVEGNVGANAGTLHVPLDVNDEADLSLSVGLVQNLNASGYGVVQADEQFFVDRMVWDLTHANQSTAPVPLPEPFANANPAAVTLHPTAGPVNLEYVVSAEWDFTYKGKAVAGAWGEVETQTVALEHLRLDSVRYPDHDESTTPPGDDPVLAPGAVPYIGIPVTDQDAFLTDVTLAAPAAGGLDAETYPFALWEIRQVDTDGGILKDVKRGSFNLDGELVDAEGGVLTQPILLELLDIVYSTQYDFIVGLDVNGDGELDHETESRHGVQAFLYYFNIQLNALSDAIEETPPGRWIEGNVGNANLVPLDVYLGYLGMPGGVTWTLDWTENLSLLWHNAGGDLIEIGADGFATSAFGAILDKGLDGHEVFYVRADDESMALGAEVINADVVANDDGEDNIPGFGLARDTRGDATDTVVLTAYKAEANLNLIISPQTELNEEVAPKYVPLNDIYDDNGTDGTITPADPDLVEGLLTLTSDASGYLQFDKPDNLSFWILTEDSTAYPSLRGIDSLLHASHSLPGAPPLVQSGAYTRLDEGLHLNSLGSETWTFPILIEGLAASPNNTSHLVTASYVYDSTNQPLDADSVRLIVSGVDLDVDSDNTNGLSLPDLNDSEELLEENDTDNGKIVYLADSLAERYTPLYLSMLAVQEATDGGTIELTYNDADSGGPLRILAIDGTYLASGVHDLSTISIDRNQNDALLWIEVVDNGQPPATETIHIAIDPDGAGIEGEVFTDSVRITPRFDVPEAAIFSHANSSHRSVISSDTVVMGMVDDDDDELVGWQLLLVPVNVHEGSSTDPFVIATSTAEAPGSLSSPAVLGTIQPALLDDGIYQLQLIATAIEKDDNGTMVPDFGRGHVVTGHLIQIQNGLHQQVFVHPETDLALDVPGLPMLTLGRYYDASQADVDNGLGYGWSLTLPQARLTRLAELAGAGDVSAGLRRGDLVTALIPGRGQVSFAFEPREIDDTPGAEIWEPRFVSIDGSGSVLGFAWDDAAYQLVQQDGEFFVEELDGLQRTLAYDPTDGTLPGSYRITMLDGWSYTLDFEAGRITGAVDAFGNTVTYSATGISAGGQTIHIERDAQTGRVLWASTDASGNGPKVLFGYDITTGDLTSVTDEAGRTTYYTYDAEHRLTAVTDAQGVEQIAVAYESDGRVSSIDRLATPHEPGVVPEGAEYIYNERNELIRIIQAQHDAQGAVTGYSIGVFTYEHAELDDADFEPVYRTFDLDGVTYRYTEAAFIRTVKQSTWLPFEIAGTDPDGLRFVQYPAVQTGEVTFLAWPENFDGTDLSLLDHLGVPVQQARLAADGKTWLIGEAEYNHTTNQATTTTDPYGNVVTNTYDAAGNLIEVLEVDPDGNVIEHLKHVYTAAGMTSYTYTLDGITANVSHLAAGLWLETVRVLDETTLAEVSLGRNVYYGNAAPGGNVGRLALATDRDAVSMRYTYWADGNVKEVFREWTQGGSFTSVRERYAEYNAAGQITLSEDVYGNATRYHYDALGRSLAIEDRFGGYTFSTYDARGNLIRRITPAGIETRWAYNEDNLLTHVSDSFVSESIFTYDPQLPGLALAWDTTSSTTLGNDATYAVTEYLYDSLDRSIGTVRHDNASIQISVDTDPVVNSTLAPAGLQILETAADLSSATTLYTTATHYDGAGRVVETVGATGVRRGTIYNNAGFAVYSGVLKSTAPAPGSGVALTPADFESATEFRYDAWNQDRIVLGDDNVRFGSVATLTFSNRQGDQEAVVSVTAGYGGGVQLMPLIVDAINNSTDALVQQVTAALDADGNIQLTLDPDADFLLRADYTSTTGFSSPEVLYADSTIRSNWSRDANGHTTLDILNAQGRVIKTVYHDGTFTESPVDTLGQPIARPDLETPGAIPTTELDGTHTVATVQRDGTDPVLATHSLYDGSGNLADVWLPAVNDPVDTSPTYNTLVRPHYQYEYNLHGDVTAITDPNGNRTEFTYDDLGRQTSRTLPIGVATTGDPDDFTETRHFDDTPIEQLTGNLSLSVGSGQLEYAVDFEGRVTAYRYDNTAAGRGRLAVRYYYNTEADYLADVATGGGTLTAAARSVAYTYNAFGQVTQIDDTGHGTTSHTYDDLGRRTQINTPEGILNYTYNALNQITRVWTSKTTAGTDAVTDTTYTYDAYGRLETVTAIERADVAVANSGDTTTYFYDAVGNLDAQTVENGTATVTTDYVFDALNRLTALYHFEDGDADLAYDAGTETLHASFVYTLDSRGNRTQSVDTVDGDTYTYTWTYDALNRLVSEQLDASDAALDYTDTFVYDLAGNRLSKTRDKGSDASVDETTTYTYDANDRLLTEVLDVIGGLRGGDKTTTYTYDGTTLVGKTVAATVGGKLHSVTTHTYNVMGRLASTTETRYDPLAKQPVVLGTTVTGYTYNAAGLRVTETTTTDPGSGGTPVVKSFLFAPRNPTGFAQVLEEYVDGVLDQVFTLGHDVVTQTDVSDPQAPDAYTLLSDGHGSTRALLDGLNAIAQQFAYDAYGNLLGGVNLTTAASALTTLLYSGEWTQANGSQYLRARFYDPASGRFNRLDPFIGNPNDPQSLHKYLYAHANPVAFSDPSGQFINVATLRQFAFNVAVHALVQFQRVVLFTSTFSVGYPTLYLIATRIVTAIFLGLEVYGFVDDPGGWMIDMQQGFAANPLGAAIGAGRGGSAAADDLRNLWKWTTRRGTRKPPFPRSIADQEGVPRVTRPDLPQHRNGAIGEEDLARRIHNELPDEVVIRWGDPIGRNGSDVISVNQRTGEVTLWDAKFRQNPVGVMQNSSTFAPGSTQLGNAHQEAIDAIANDTTLPPHIRQQALENLQMGQFRTITSGEGNATSSPLPPN